MSWYDFKAIKKDQANDNNYKLQLFNLLSQESNTANLSSIKKYFDNLYDSYGDAFSSFSVTQSVDGVYAAEETNKARRLWEYRDMTSTAEVDRSINMICYSADIPDENNELV